MASKPLVVVVDDDINEDIKQQTKVEKQHDQLMLFTAETRARLRHARFFVVIEDDQRNETGGRDSISELRADTKKVIQSKMSTKECAGGDEEQFSSIVYSRNQGLRLTDNNGKNSNLQINIGRDGDGGFSPSLKEFESEKQEQQQQHTLRQIKKTVTTKV